MSEILQENALQENSDKTNVQKLEPDASKLKLLAKKLLQQKQKCDTEIQKLKRDNTKYRKNIQDHITSFEALQQSHNELSSRALQMQTDNDTLRLQLQESEASNKQNDDSNALMVHQLNDQIIVLKERIKQRTETTKDVAALKQNVSEWKNKYNVSVARDQLEIQDANTRYDTLKQNHIALTTQLETTRQDHEKTMNKLSNQIQTLRKEKENVLMANQETQWRVCEKQQELQSLANQISSLKSTITELDQSLEIAQEENEMMKNQIADASSNNKQSRKRMILKTVVLGSLMTGGFAYWHKNKISSK
eukprot:126033_1